jgi:Holliday junction resolvase
VGRELKFLRDEPQDRRRKSSRTQERSVAKSLGGRETIGSGNKGQKGDVWAASMMVECKATEKQSMGVKLEWLEKLVKEAFQAAREPVLVLRFLAMKSQARDWAVIPLERYKELLEVEHDTRVERVQRY